MSGATCASCKWFDSFGKDGRCRRYPAVWQSVEAEWSQPVMHATEVCGEHAARAEPVHGHWGELKREPVALTATELQEKLREQAAAEELWEGPSGNKYRVAPGTAMPEGCTRIAPAAPFAGGAVWRVLGPFDGSWIISHDQDPAGVTRLRAYDQEIANRTSAALNALNAADREARAMGVLRRMDRWYAAVNGGGAPQESWEPIRDAARALVAEEGAERG